MARMSAKNYAVPTPPMRQQEPVGVQMNNPSAMRQVRPSRAGRTQMMKSGGSVKKMASGGSASKRADGCAQRGKTKGKIV